MIPGIHPRASLPLTWAGLACYWWLLTVGRHHSGRWWVLPIAAGFPVISLVLAARQWKRLARVADALTGRIEPDPAVAEEVDKVAWRIDDTGRFPAIFQTVAFLLVLIGFGLDAGVLHGRWIALVPVCGLAAVGAVTVVVLRRRRRDVERWLEQRPRPADWRSVPP